MHTPCFHSIWSTYTTLQLVHTIRHVSWEPPTSFVQVCYWVSRNEGCCGVGESLASSTRTWQGKVCFVLQFSREPHFFLPPSVFLPSPFLPPFSLSIPSILPLNFVLLRAFLVLFSIHFIAISLFPFWSKTDFSFLFMTTYVWYSMEKLGGDLLFGLKFVKLSTLPTLFIHFP